MNGQGFMERLECLAVLLCYRLVRVLLQGKQSHRAFVRLGYRLSDWHCALNLKEVCYIFLADTWSR